MPAGVTVVALDEYVTTDPESEAVLSSTPTRVKNGDEMTTAVDETGETAECGVQSQVASEGALQTVAVAQSGAVV